MRETPLHDAHLRLGARMVDFGGWSMPVSYGSGIIDEHRATRTAVGVFDVCHMGEVHFRGPRAAEALQRVITNDLGKLTDGRALYTVACLETGGIVDDLIVYRLSDAHYLVVVNATTREKDVAWFIEHGRGDCDIVDASDETGLIAFQGPAAQRALQTLTAASLGALPRFSILTADVAGLRVAIARTGYTGEDGFEIFCDAGDARALWDGLVEAAGTVGGKPVGLGRARHPAPRSPAAALRAGSRRDDHPARGWPRVGREAGRRAVRRSPGAARAETGGRQTQAGRLRDGRARCRAP